MATNSNILSFTYDGSPVFYTLNTVLGVQHNETSASTASTLAEYTLGKDISPLISMRRLLNNMGAKGHITSISAIPTVSASSDMSMMFAFNESLSAIDITSLEIVSSGVTDMSQLFQDDKSITSLDLNTLCTSAVTNMNSMFSFCKSLSSITGNVHYEDKTITASPIDITYIDMRNVSNANYMYAACDNLTTFDHRYDNTMTGLTSIKGMFYHSGFESIYFPEDDSIQYLKKVKSYYNVFNKCTQLKNLIFRGVGTNESALTLYMGDCTGLTDASIIDLSDHSYDRTSYASACTITFSERNDLENLPADLNTSLCNLLDKKYIVYFGHKLFSKTADYSQYSGENVTVKYTVVKDKIVTNP